MTFEESRLFHVGDKAPEICDTEWDFAGILVVSKRPICLIPNGPSP